MEKKKTVCVIPGDDALPEAVWPSVELLESMELPIDFLWRLSGKQTQQKYGKGFPDELRKLIDQTDATLFGSSGVERISTNVLQYLRWWKETYANVRPVRWWPGTRSPLRNPEGIDYIIVRENMEDVNGGVEADLSLLKEVALPKGHRTGKPLNLDRPGRFGTKIVTVEGTKRVARFTAGLGLRRQKRGRGGKVTIAVSGVTASQCDALFRDVATEVIKGYPTLELEYLKTDNFAHQQVVNPQRFDVVLIQNNAGDLLSDSGAGTVGGLGLAPSGCYGDSFAYFEPIHGSAPDIAGKHIINPTSVLLSASMMLGYLGLPEAEERLEKAIAAVYREGKHLTPDQGGRATTTEFCHAVKAKL